MIKGRRGTDGVGARIVLRPTRTLLKAHLARPLARLRVTGDPQKVGRRVTDRDNVSRILIQAGKRRVHDANRRVSGERCRASSSSSDVSRTGAPAWSGATPA